MLLRVAELRKEKHHDLFVTTIQKQTLWRLQKLLILKVSPIWCSYWRSPQFSFHRSLSLKNWSTNQPPKNKLYLKQNVVDFDMKNLLMALKLNLIYNFIFVKTFPHIAPSIPFTPKTPPPSPPLWQVLRSRTSESESSRRKNTEGKKLRWTNEYPLKMVFSPENLGDSYWKPYKF